ncbi:MAG: hypothetical protein PVG60_00825 [Desulfarculaceae bacterium]
MSPGKTRVPAGGHARVEAGRLAGSVARHVSRHGARHRARHTLHARHGSVLRAIVLVPNMGRRRAAGMAHGRRSALGVRRRSHGWSACIAHFRTSPRACGLPHLRSALRAARIAASARAARLAHLGPGLASGHGVHAGLRTILFITGRALGLIWTSLAGLGLGLATSLGSPAHLPGILRLGLWVGCLPGLASLDAPFLPGCFAFTFMVRHHSLL